MIVANALLFVAAHRWGAASPTWGWVLAFSEAAMVGGLADWFAVSALFRHPLGLPIPHTAIIPASRDRIADAMGGFLSRNFLTPAVVARRLQGVDFAGLLGAWLADPQAHASARLGAGARALGVDLLDALGGERQLGRHLRTALRRRLGAMAVAPLLGRLLAAALAAGRHRPLIEAGLRWAGDALEANEALLRGMIHARANAILRWTGLDERLANSILDGLYRLLAECIVDPDHPLRQRFEAGLAQLAEDLQHDRATQARVEQAKRALLASPALAAWFDGLWGRARARLLGPASVGRRPSGAAWGGLAQLGVALRDDAQTAAHANRIARRIITGLASRHAEAIVSVVSETVKRWDARTVSTRIEAVVGRDLQFIRLNGTLVGGLVGVVLHAVAHWL